jgi:MFS transporter, DHA2 family, multidrug resistance protein
LNFQKLLNQLTGAFTAQGYDAVTAAKKALAQAYAMAQAQASVLGFENAFWIMSVTILCLVPFPFVMRRPPAGQQGGMRGH